MSVYPRSGTRWDSRAAAGALLLSLVAAGTAKAADTGIYRDGDFNQTDNKMTACPAAILAKRHAELRFVVGQTGGNFVLAGLRDSSSVIWLVVAKRTGPKSSHVELHNKGAEPFELNEVWQAVEACESM
jgi:hypothetical protein